MHVAILNPQQTYCSVLEFEESLAPVMPDEQVEEVHLCMRTRTLGSRSSF